MEVYLEAWNSVFVPVVSRRTNLLPKDDLEAKRHLKPERVMLTEVQFVQWACASITLPLASAGELTTLVVWRCGETHPYG